MTEPRRAAPDLPENTRGDPLLRMRAYQLGCALLDEVWDDALKLSRHRVTEKVATQLYSAVGSIPANLAEGYSRSSGRDRARLFEYALGSARESTVWYKAGRPVLGSEVVNERQDTLDEIGRLLSATIPRERDRLIRPSPNPRRPGR